MTTTRYNGTKSCTSCGRQIDPVKAMISPDLCTSCRRTKHDKHVRRGMA
jgi:predicted RNA-binding Zn-ribbon protein involved in translation (DUF1610 family)